MNSCVSCADTGMTHQNEELFQGADQAENPPSQKLAAQACRWERRQELAK